MSAMDDVQIYRPASERPSGALRGLRDLALATGLVIMAALALQSYDQSRRSGAEAATPNVSEHWRGIGEWRGNSGTLSVTPAELAE